MRERQTERQEDTERNRLSWLGGGAQHLLKSISVPQGKYSHSRNVPRIVSADAESLKGRLWKCLIYDNQTYSKVTRPAVPFPHWLKEGPSMWNFFHFKMELRGLGIWLSWWNTYPACMRVPSLAVQTMMSALSPRCRDQRMWPQPADTCSFLSSQLTVGTSNTIVFWLEAKLGPGSTHF